MTEQALRIVILGAGSAIAEATARIWAADGARLILVGRDITRLGHIAADLKSRGASEAMPWLLDCAAPDSPATLDQMVQSLGALDVVLLAYGALGEQGQLERDPNAVAAIIQTNFTSAVGWCLAVASVLERQRAGSLLVIGSVAGDRGRQSNFIYGATKGGLARLVEGLAHKLAPLGARAVLIKPGFHRYANDGERAEQAGTIVGSTGGHRAVDRSHRPTRRTGLVCAADLAGHHAGRQEFADSSVQ